MQLLLFGATVRIRVLLYKFYGAVCRETTLPHFMSIQRNRDMKHESIVVVYDSCQAIAEEIADKLGAETVSVQSLNNRQVENSQSLVLAVEFQADGPLSPHWQYACQMLRGASLSGKNIAVMVALGNSQDNGIYAEAFFSELRQNGAHIVGEQLYASTSGWNTDNWICSVSPNL